MTNNSNKYLNFKVYGLDCVEEVSLIKKALYKTIDKDALEFDLLNGKLKISHNDDLTVSSKEIIALIKKFGLNAILWSDFISSDTKESFIQKNSKLITTSVSGVLILIAYFYHASLYGYIPAFIADGSHGNHYPPLSKVLYLCAIAFGSWFVYIKAWSSIKRLDADMNLLMVIAITSAVAIGQYFEASIVSFLFSLSLLLESWSVGNARTAITKLMDLTPDTALVYYNHDKEFEAKPITEINVGRTVLIKPGEKVAIDGNVSKGTGFLNQAPITGESMPIEKKIGDIVYAGSINGNTAIEIVTTKTSDQSSVAKIIQSIESAQSKRSKSEKWVDKFARIYTPCMMVLALVIAIVPPLLFNQPWFYWVYEALVILVIACPCALVISTPISIISALASAAKNGVLIKGGTFLEIPAKLKVIAFDKTGTLTQGKPATREIITNGYYSKDDLITVAASLEKNIDHPIALAIINYAKENNIVIKNTDDARVIEGRGVTGTIDNQEYWLGSHIFAHEKELCKNIDIHNKVVEFEKLGYTIIFVGSQDTLIGIVAIQDTLKEGVELALGNLKKVGICKNVMLTGDNYGTATTIASQSGIDDYYAELLPLDKVDKIEDLVNEYEYVAMIGDGINDAPALARSSLGIAMAAIGNDIAIETADIALMSDDINKLPWLINHSKRTMKIIKQNIVFSISVKAIFVCLALTGLATLWMAIAADIGATFLVIMNALRLLKIKVSSLGTLSQIL